MNTFVCALLSATRESPRLFFAPLISTIKGTREAVREAIDDARQEMERRKREETKEHRGDVS